MKKIKLFSKVKLNRRVLWIYGLSGIIVCVFLIQGFRLQIWPSERLVQTKKNLFEKVVTIKPRRGVIYDRYGRELALSVSSYSLFADPSLLKNPRRVAQKLTRLLGVSQKNIFNKIKNKKRRFVWLKRHIAEKHREKIKSWDIYGLGFIEEPKRVYPNGKLMSQVLGFTGIDGRGLEGLELVFDEYLRGMTQKIITPRDARGRSLFIDGGLFINKSRGSDIYLTIDSDLQFVMERELESAVKKFQARSAVGLILSVDDSEILALAHYPNFDPNWPFKYSSELYRNRIVADAFEPGSTFKTFSVATALKEKLAPHTLFDGRKGKLVIGKHIIHEAEEDHKYEKLTISDILSVSSNVGSALLALKLTDRVLYSSLKGFGFGQKMGVSFPLEGRGVLQPLPWRDILTGNVGFGQGISTTPLQLAVGYMAIANGGLLRKPKILRSIVNVSGQKKSYSFSSNERRILSEENSKILTFMLTQATSQKGTGFRARIEGFLTAGKTGTAQKPDLKKGGYIPGKYISSFAGFVPSDHPRFVIYVAVDEPTKKFYGSTVAAPIFSQVGSYAVRRASLAPSIVEEPHVIERPQLFVSKNSSKSVISKEKTPNFVGLSLRESLQKAKNEDLKLRIKGFGLVLQSIPFSGSPLPKDRTITLIFGNS